MGNRCGIIKCKYREFCIEFINENIINNNISETKNFLLLPEFGFYQPEHLGWKKLINLFLFQKDYPTFATQKTIFNGKPFSNEKRCASKQKT
jgi:hypothetical protein